MLRVFIAYSQAVSISAPRDWLVDFILFYLNNEYLFNIWHLDWNCSIMTKTIYAFFVWITVDFQQKTPLTLCIKDLETHFMFFFQE